MAIWHRQFARLTNLRCGARQRPRARHMHTNAAISIIARMHLHMIATRIVFRPPKSASSFPFWWRNEQQMARENRDRPRGHRVADDKRNRDAAIKRREERAARAIDRPNERVNDEIQTPGTIHIHMCDAYRLLLLLNAIGTVMCRLVGDWTRIYRCCCF